MYFNTKLSNPMLNFEKSETLSTNIFQLNRNLNPLVNFEFSKHPRSQEVTQQTLKKTKDTGPLKP